ncbi:hypothetical protein OH733_17010 [Streptomyces griseus]|uniref:hypothetical protein n=1 Tax=Streptomyces griseus TaxID=1911 RepID=UPI00386BD1AA|nr:hypothetical protein OH733_17010 [Streptomyces griseus]WTD69033.1 hypothetical protein OH763_19980 [Streptomyces griseus]
MRYGSSWTVTSERPLRQPGAALGTAETEASHETDAEYLQAESRPQVVAIVGRLAQVMIAHDLGELLALHEARVASEAPQ